LSRTSHDAIIMPERCYAVRMLAMLYLSFSDELAAMSVDCLNLMLFLAKTVVDSLKYHKTLRAQSNHSTPIKSTHVSSYQNEILKCTFI
jgi:hypothetical protein